MAARPQLVVVVDTDLPPSGSLVEHPELSPDASVDTIRVDVLSPTGVPYDVNQFLIANEETLPISFGIPAGESPSVRLRIRIFRSDFADVGSVVLSGSDGGTLSVLDPVPSVTVDRAVDVDLPTEGVRTVLVTLHADCMGITPIFGSSAMTCLDKDHPHAPASSGIDDIPDPKAVDSMVGKWAGAVMVPCTGTPPSGSVCIPGGFTMMGDLLFRDDSDSQDPAPFPIHPVVVSPYFLDVNEYTVARLQEAVAQGYDGVLPQTKSTTGDQCTWPGAGKAGQGSYPVNCIESPDAAAVCKAAGGALPTEAQWEHAARGRGQGRLFPWGNEDPNCCIVSADRLSDCGAGIEPAGSHPATCAGNLGDVSRDGVFDLAGGVVEAMSDDLIDYNQGCWNYQGIGKDKPCGGGANKAGRGGSWSSELFGIGGVGAPLRHLYAKGISNGFRCAYPNGVE